VSQLDKVAAMRASRPPAARPRRKVDRDAAPAGYDADIWRLAVEFQSTAESWDVGLAAGLPILYAGIARRLASSGLRETPGWATTASRMIKVFWDDEVDPGNETYAIDQFTGESWNDSLAAVEYEDDAARWREIWASQTAGVSK
jgi:hypothetical protein